MREKLPARRYCESFDVAFPPHSFTLYGVTIGCYDDGRIGEVFISSYQKAGSQLDMAARDTALLISIALQHGVPLELMAHAATKDASGHPEGLAGIVLSELVVWEQRRTGSPERLGAGNEGRGEQSEGAETSFAPPSGEDRQPVGGP